MNLTKKENVVMSYITQGLRPLEIAVLTGSRRRTVEFHIYNAYKKLGADNRVTAVHAYLSDAPARV